MKKYFIVGLIMSFLTAPSLAIAEESNSSNYSEEQIVLMIAKLQKQLEEIRKNSVICNVSGLDLSLGDGESEDSKYDVKSLQSFLKEKGYFQGNPTGYFGKVTRSAMLGFQKGHNLSQTGELDNQTRTFVKSLKCKKDYLNKKIEQKSEKMEKKMGENKEGKVFSIQLSADGKKVKWTTDGYSRNGFKVVWSKNSGPMYPTREGDKYLYLSEPTASYGELEAFSGEGLYKVRVCEYLGGSCGVYSNEITTSI